MEPTKEQIQWLWERCGLHLERECGGLVWFDSNNILVLELDLDLNSLFRYAVPRLIEELNKSHNWDEKGCLNRILKDWQRIYWGSKGILSYGSALFWAIYKALGGE